jgi:N-acetylglucosamine-6-phosphate deacetylase
VLDAVRAARERLAAGAARVLPAHLESNFLSPEYRGAQPLECLRTPPTVGGAFVPAVPSADLPFSAADVLAEIERAAPDVGIVTLAPELEGALDLITFLRAMGCRVSLGHSGATYDQARSAIAAGATGATHLFNRMPPIGHREPGLAGAVLERPELVAEIICDGHHVHPAMIAMTVAAKGRSATMAITDSLAGAGLPVGSRVSLGGRSVTVRAAGAYLDDGTLAGSVQTMDGAFRVLTSVVGLGVVDAVHLCASTPAREMGLTGFGVIASGAAADLVALDRRLIVRRTWIAGRLAFPGHL